ncbi:MAG: cobalamin biosynthesis protein CobD, partial [Clostridiales bacterium]
GDAYYFGQLCHKPTIGDPLRQVEAEDICRSHKLLRITAWLMLLLAVVVRLIIIIGWWFYAAL